MLKDVVYVMMTRVQTDLSVYRCSHVENMRLHEEPDAVLAEIQFYYVSNITCISFLFSQQASNAGQQVSNS